MDRSSDAVDGISFLEEDHRRIEALLSDLDRIGEVAPRAMLEELDEELSAHAAAELEVLYPAAKRSARLGTEVKQARLDHEEAAITLERLGEVRMDAASFRSELDHLLEVITSHFRAEEEEMFPALRASMTESQQQQLGEDLQRALRHAPRHLHPRGPKSKYGSRIFDRMTTIAEKASPTHRREGDAPTSQH